jgi:hypothetical protein
VSKKQSSLLHLFTGCLSLCSLLDKVYVRQEVWKYRRVFDGYEKRWMSTPFKQLDINMINTKVTHTVKPFGTEPLQIFALTLQ